MGYHAEMAVLTTAASTFRGLVAGLTASLTGPVPASLSQYATDSAELVEPLLEAATALTDAVAHVLTDLEVRVAKLENPGG